MADALAGRRQLGSTGIEVAELCLGGNVFGWTAGAASSFEVLDAYASAGGNFIDTADSYSHWVPGNAGGESETIIGDWMAARGNRDDLVIATKVGKDPRAMGLSATNIAQQVEASLRRLRTDHIDLYYAHQDDPSVPIEDYLATFDDLVRSGKVRCIGASNYTAPRLLEALSVSQAQGWSSFAALQNHYNLVERAEYEDQMRELVASHGLASLPYYGLARGFLTGKYRGGTAVDSPRAGGIEPYLNDRGERILATVEACATRHETSAAAIALAWLLAQPTVTSPIASARNVEQLSDLLDMTAVTLTDDELAELDDASR